MAIDKYVLLSVSIKFKVSIFVFDTNLFIIPYWPSRATQDLSVNWNVQDALED